MSVFTKSIMTALLFAMLGAQAPAKELNPADYPLTARILSVEDMGSTGVSAPVMNSQTGIVTGAAASSVRNPDREEVQIGDAIYVTTLLSRGGLSGKVGDRFRAAFGKKHGLDVIYLLGTDKHGKAKVVTLEIVGHRAN